VIVGSFVGQWPALFGIARRYMWTVPIVAVLGVLASAVEGIGIGLLIPLISTIVQNGTWAPDNVFIALIDKIASSLDHRAHLQFIGATIFGCVILKCTIQMINRRFIGWADGRIANDVRCALSETLVTVGYQFYLRYEPGYLIEIVSGKIWRVVEAIRAWYSLVAAGAAASIFALALVAVSWRMSLIVGVGVIVIRMMHNYLARGLNKRSDIWTSANTELTDRMFTLVTGARLVRIYGQENREKTRFVQVSEKVFKTWLALEVPSSWLEPALEVAHTALFILLLLGAYQAGSNIALVVTFLVLLYRMQPHLRAMETARSTLASLSGAMREVNWFLDASDKPAPPTGHLSFKDWRQSIVFEDVCFSYPGRAVRAPALKGVSFSVVFGAATALVGPSGAGKSTIVNLILRLYDPDAGQIRVDGISIAELNPRDWRASIAFAGQDVEFLDGTIYDNILMGREGATAADVERAACDADADSFIRALPQGYQTDVASRGLNLSAGQRQRIALARALIRDPQLLILDEATNAVDGVSETTILNALHRRAGRATTLVISHRASTLAACNQAIVVDGGRVVEKGSLSELHWYRKALAELA
jgi:subfamily B ATP-binding cassette protein MsbA